jgi:L-alanine-DL-glutamate epimerase-like enolase superfamily enzyme
MKITDIRTHVLLDPAVAADATSSSQDTILVEIETDEGLVGIGETDLNAWVAKACLTAPSTHTMDQGLAHRLIGRDPRDVEAIWDELYIGSAMTGRRGAGVHALGALDIALWDLVGQAAGRPCWSLWTDEQRDHLTPYASLQPDSTSPAAYLDSMVDWARRAVDLGFEAVKLEATFDGPYRHKGLSAPDERVHEVVEAVRSTVGPDTTIMVDVQYAFMHSPERALKTAEALAELGVYFLEAPLWPDDLDAYAWLCERSPVSIAAGEWLSTRHEFDALIDRGRVPIVQPDIGRVGGLTEARRICDRAGEAGITVVPHAWKTGVTIAAVSHLAMATPHMPFFEFLPAEICESELRAKLTRDELVFDAGRLGIPERPGLGIDLDRDALARFEETARAATPQQWAAAGA